MILLNACGDQTTYIQSERKCSAHAVAGREARKTTAKHMKEERATDGNRSSRILRLRLKGMRVTTAISYSDSAEGKAHDEERVLYIPSQTRPGQRRLQNGARQNKQLQQKGTGQTGTTYTKTARRANAGDKSRGDQ